MSKLRVTAFASVAALVLAGTAFAATNKNLAGKDHVMNVALPDGSVAHVEYVGDVAPKVTIEPRTFAGFAWAPMAIPSFAGFDRMIEQMNRESQAMIRQAQAMAHRPTAGLASKYIASYSNMPSGATSTTIVSYSNAGQTCTRTTEAVSQGIGKPPKVTSSVTGECNAAAPGASATHVNRT